MQTIYLDISNKGVVPTIYAKQGEVGRKFTAVLTDAGVPYVLDESDLLSAWYEGTSGIGNYTTVGGNSAFTVDGNKVAIELITQMLTNDGGGVLSVSINKTDGSEIATWNIPYLVEKKPGVDSPEAETFYTAFSEIARQVADYASRAEAAAENLENITPEAIGARPNTWTPNAEEVGAAPAIEDATFPGCYYRMVGGEREWINPPMVFGVEYRTTERQQEKPVYTQLVNFGALPDNTYKSIDVTAVGITDMVFYKARYTDGTNGSIIGGAGEVSSNYSIVGNQIKFFITAPANSSAFNVFVTLKYIK